MGKYNLRYDASQVGMKFTYNPAQGYSATWTTNISNGGKWNTPNKGDYFIATGYYFVSDSSSIVWILTTVGVYISAQFYDDEWKKVWNTTPNFSTIPKYGDSDARKMIQRIVNNDQTIICNNLCLARFASKLTQAERQQVRNLQNRLTERQNELINGGLITEVQTSYPAGYAELSAYLDELMVGEAIGIAPIVYVIVAFVIAAGTGAAVYYGYKYLFDESEQDIKYSKQLMAVLQQKLTPEEYQQLLDETKGIVTKARIKQAAGSYWNVLKYAALAFAGYSVYKFIKSRQQ